MLKKTLKYNIAWVLWTGFILYVLLIKKSRIPKFDFDFWVPPDKIVHFFLFFVLIELLCVGFYFQKKVLFDGHKGVVLFFLIALVFSGATEVMQSVFKIDRTADWFDFAANTTGLILGSVFFEHVLKKNIVKNKKCLFLS